MLAACLRRALFIDWETLARDALGWMSEAEVAEFAQRNDYITDTDEDEE